MRRSVELRVPPLRGNESRLSALGLIPDQDSSRSILVPIPSAQHSSDRFAAASPVHMLRVVQPLYFAFGIVLGCASREEE